MNLKQLIDEANNLADDFLTEDEAKNFINDAIAAINIEANTDFPFLETMSDEPAFPEKWQRMLIIPYAKGRIKEKDSSHFEWQEGYEQFYANLQLFIRDYEVPDEYKAKDSKYNDTRGSIVDNIPYGWGGW